MIEPIEATIVEERPALTRRVGAEIAIEDRVSMMRVQVKAETEIRALVKEYIARNMVSGSDYGVIPGTDKPTLLKPGAEKLVDLFNVVPEFSVAQRIEDWERGLFHYEVHVTLRDRVSGSVRAEGMGSANSREARYRWRNSERTCPACGAPTIIKGKEEYGGGWLCWAKRGGCGAKFAASDPAIVEQAVGKVENDDIYTLVNTILKMAKKRCLVDGAIALARCSDIFTQDVEDLDLHGSETAPTPSTESKKPQRRSTPAPATAAKEPTLPPGPISASQVKNILSLGALAEFTDEAWRPVVEEEIGMRVEEVQGPDYVRTYKLVREMARGIAATPKGQSA